MLLSACRNVLQVTTETLLGSSWENVFPVTVTDIRTSVWMDLESVWWVSLSFLKAFWLCYTINFTLHAFQSCQHNTIGDHCESCRGGFLSNNSLDGQAVSCSSCPCPLRAPSNKSAFLLHSELLFFHSYWVFQELILLYLCAALQRAACRGVTGCSVCVCTAMLDQTVRGNHNFSLKQRENTHPRFSYLVQVLARL